MAPHEMPSLPAKPTYPSEPGLEGVLSEERDETEATDRGREDDGMVKERTMERGRLPLLSSRPEGWERKKNMLTPRTLWTESCVEATSAVWDPDLCGSTLPTPFPLLF